MKPRMNLLKMRIIVIMVTAVLVLFSATSFAEEEYIHVENVEELLDNVARYADKKVRVPGEIEEINGHVFILESGGIFNDEIVVVIPEKGVTITERITEGDHAAVAGTVRTIGFIEVEREYGLDMNPEIEIELERVEAFLIADRIDAWEEKDDSSGY